MGDCLGESVEGGESKERMLRGEEDRSMLPIHIKTT
jgi:hypothetical protein